MNLKRNIVNLLICAMFAFSSGTFAGDKKASEKEKLSNSEKAKMILEKAKKTMCGKGAVKSFSALFKSQVMAKTKGAKMTVACRFNPDGIIFLRVDTIFPKSLKAALRNTYILNESGTYYVLENFAIKETYKQKIGFLLDDIDITKSNKYSVRSSKSSSIGKFYIVTEKITSENGKNNDIANLQYFITSDFYFLFSKKEYNKNGKLMNEKSYENLKINTPIDDSLFEIDKNLEIKIANKSEDTSDLFIKDKLIVLKRKGLISEKESKEIKNKLNLK